MLALATIAATLFVAGAQPLHDWDVSESTSVIWETTGVVFGGIHFHQDISLWNVQHCSKLAQNDSDNMSLDNGCNKSSHAKD